ncbi:MAG TPA: hypothetical protein VIC59_06760 [Gemmatimonadota bacterium]
MSLRFIELERFRNFPSLSLELDLRGGVLEAPNGRGKTNLLEALHYLSLFRSFRGAPDVELAAFGEQGFRIRGEAVAQDGSGRQVGVGVEGVRKRLAIDGRERRLAEHVGAVASVVLCPDDIRLVQGDPARRRRYLDVVLALSSRRYLKASQEYRRVLKQRNRVLQTGGGLALLEPWTDQLVEHGAAIVAERLRFLARWGARLGVISGRLAGAPEGSVAWSYQSSAAVSDAVQVVSAPVAGHIDASPPALFEGTASLAEPFGGLTSPAGVDAGADPGEGAEFDALALAGALREELARRATVERRRGMTLAGPHRDDLGLWIGVGEGPGRDLRRFGSQGEQRTAALALRFLEAEVLTHERGELPIVLLDDVFSELDPARSRELLGFLAPGQQVFLTTPKPLAVELPIDLPRLTIEGGRLRPAP